MRLIILVSLICSAFGMLFSQTGTITGSVYFEGHPLEFATVAVKNTGTGGITDSLGNFQIQAIPFGEYEVVASIIGFHSQGKKINLQSGSPEAVLFFSLEAAVATLDEVVVSGTMKEVNKLDSPVPVEVYSSKFFQSNPSPSIFESMQHVNGVRPQLNCNVCNTGDIHINGLEGPYTMVLIDGMPIVSGLSTVYGLTGIPQALIERVEIVKGPASTLYGSEAVGGLINIITKKTSTAPSVSTDIFGTGWGEVSADVGLKLSAGNRAQSLLGINYFNYQNPVDNNDDGFTDLTLQNRISIFNKWSFERKDRKDLSIAMRYVYEDRWGGEMDWTPEYRASEEVYGESIYTNRWELFGNYQLPIKAPVSFQFSANGHNQNSVYGSTVYNADQYIGFGQLIWNASPAPRHDLLLGAAFRYVYYDDNTPATATFDLAGLKNNKASVSYLPGIFAQDEIAINTQNKLLLGLRYDYNSLHGHILSPRINYKWNTADKKNTVRLSAGNGYRIANVFTEDHAALTGARKVEFHDALQPERSWNANLNFVKKMYAHNDTYLSLDASVFYTYFTNRIIADYDIDPNKIIYDNLDGFAVSKGLSLNLDVAFTNGLSMLAGFTAMDVSYQEGGEKTRQVLTERFSGVWNIGYTFLHTGISIDYTGNLYGPMRLPVLNELDNRPANSPWWSIQNIQATLKMKNGLAVYGGVKNLLNFTPPANSIARAFDPFDKNVQFDEAGQVVPTADNPHALTFDPAYVFAPNQGIRAFFGFRYTLY